MVWGKGSFKKEYLQLLPEVIKILEIEGLEKPKDLESRSEEYEKIGKFISNFSGKHPGDMLRRYHLTEFFIDGLTKRGEEAKDKLQKILYSELKVEDAKKLEEKYMF